MAPGQYQGPTLLTSSKYATPAMKAAAALATASAASSPIAAVARRDNNNVIATQEQIAALNAASQATFDMAEHNADAQLAIDLGHDTRAEVEKHTAKFSRTLSSTVANTHRLLELIRESMPAAIDSPVDKLWTELEQLFAAANDAKAALPAFLEKQRNNMSLYNSSMMNDIVRDTQQELNIAHKKVNVQHTLILDHQEAFQEYKAQVSAKLKELENLQERVSRLTLEKGNFRTEIDKYVKLLEEERSTKAEDLRKVDDLQKELNTLVDSKKLLLAEIDTLRKEVENLQDKMKVAEQEITDRSTVELKSKADLLIKDTQKTTALNTMINQLKGGESTASLEAEKVKKENKALTERYANQAAEHAKAFTTLTEQTKQIDSLKTDVGRFQKENADLKQRLSKIADLEMLITEQNAAKLTLSEQITSLTADKETAKNDGSKAKAEVKGLLKKVTTLDREADNLGLENTQLKTTVEEFKATKSTSTVVGSSDEKAVRALEEKIVGLETALKEWTDLAKRSYKEYKDMLPTYKRADQYRKDVEELRLELKAAKAQQTNGVGSAAGGDVTYWKNKYEILMTTISS